jgi:hypothetical protein
MNNLPNSPFLTADFSPKGGGIDFLGLRWVNLTIVGRDLIPELNNAASDMGTYFLGAWIPWKFGQLCSTQKEDYTEKNYKVFREKVEVALSLTLREESKMERSFGVVRNRIGMTQKFNLPGKLSFKDSSRTDQNSLYAAAIYGPSLRALGFIKTYHSQAQDGRASLKIPCTGDDKDALQIVTGVDESLATAKSYQLLASLDSPAFNWQDIRDLGTKGLDPARYRAPEYGLLKECFRRKLVPSDPNDSGYKRTLTTRLLLATLRQRGGLSASDVRNVWYTGMFSDGTPFCVLELDIAHQHQRWSCFIARQYQRYAIELFLWCFEDALKAGARSVDDVIDHWSDRSARVGAKLDGTFRDIMEQCAGSLYQRDEIATSRAWNASVHWTDSRFEFTKDPQGDKAVVSGLRMLAGWYWRMLVRQQEDETKGLMSLGNPDRMSMAWFLKWLEGRQDRPMRELLEDIFSDLVFTQHMRVALARFDGTTQRLRFLLSDSGIERTVSAREDLGLPWMSDRLDTLIALLCDCDVLVMKETKMCLGLIAAEVLSDDAQTAVESVGS